MTYKTTTSYSNLTNLGVSGLQTRCPSLAVVQTFHIRDLAGRRYQ